MKRWYACYAAVAVLITAFATGLSVFSCAHTTAKPERTLPAAQKTLRIFIDPGHTKRTSSAKGIAGEEYVLNYKVAAYLKEFLDADKRFYCELSRNETEYERKIYDTVERNSNAFRAMATLKVPVDRRATGLDVWSRMEMYGVRYYALEKDFDYLISVHFDYNWYQKNNHKKEGFHVAVSPYNREFEDSLALAYCVQSAMAQEYAISKDVVHNNNDIVPQSIRAAYHMHRLLRYGIAVRSLLVLGDIFEHTYYERNALVFEDDDIPSILIECGYVHEKKFLDEKALKDVAERIYFGLIKVYNGEYSLDKVKR